MNSIASNTAILKQILKKKEVVNENVSRFPINSKDELKKIDEDIAENKEEFINTVKVIIGNDPLPKRFNRLFGEEIILDFNYDGLRGKEAFRNYKNVVDVLFRALSTQDGYCADDLKKAIKKGFQINKNRIFKDACISRQAMAKKDKENVNN